MEEKEEKNFPHIETTEIVNFFYKIKPRSMLK